jgi:hypothetical protein
MEISMNARLTDYLDEFEPANVKPASHTKSNIATEQGRSSKTNIPLWLANNAPRNVEELKAIRYTLYHRCSRAQFKVSEKHDDDDFVLSGRQSSLHVVSNRARRYLLWQLRILAREEGWAGRKRIQLTAIG